MAVSELPGNPNAVWTVKRRYDEEFDAYIVVSFVNATLVLSIGETVEEVTDSGFLGTTPTLSCAQIGDDALVQVGSRAFYTFVTFFLMIFCPGVPRWYSSHQIRQACERMEDPWQEGNCAVRRQLEASGDRPHRGGAGLL